MKKIAIITVLGASLFGLSACVTTSAGTPQQMQSTITQASMISDSADCNQIAQNIQAMDQIIVASNSQKQAYGYNGYNAPAQAINNSLYQSGKIHTNPGLSVVPGLVNTWASATAPSNIQYQQANAASQQKARLVSIFQQKKCVQVH